MKYKILFLVAICNCCGIIYAQPDTLWTRSYGGSDLDIGWCVQKTYDNGYVIAGETGSFGAGSHDIWLIKTDSCGDTLWTRTYGGSKADEGYFVQQTSDSGYILVGRTSSFGSQEKIWLIKTDRNGDTLWTRTFEKLYHSCEVGGCVRETSDSGYIILQATLNAGAGACGDGGWLIKTDKNGDTLWTRTYGEDGREEVGWFVEETSDSGYIALVDVFNPASGNGCSWLIKTDKNGDSLWIQGLPRSSYMCKTSDKGYAVTGSYYETDTSKGKIFLIKVDSCGDYVWEKLYEEGEASCIQQTSKGNYIISGGTYGDLILMKIDTNSNKIWSIISDGGIFYRAGRFVQETKNGDYITVGYTDTGTSSLDVFLVKVRENEGIEEKSCLPARQISKLNISQNPFTRNTTISYSVPARGKVSLGVYDLSGRCVRTLVDVEKGTGEYNVKLNARGLETGVYFVRLKTGYYKETQKVVLMK